MSRLIFEARRRIPATGRKGTITIDRRRSCPGWCRRRCCAGCCPI